MKKIGKFTAALMAAITFAVMFMCVSVSALSRMNYALEYDYYGTAFLSVSPLYTGDRITFTTDGSTPKYTSSVYINDDPIYRKTSFRLAEFNSDGKMVAAMKITITPKAARVTITSTDAANGTMVKLVCSTPDSEIYYTTDGSTPTLTSQRYNGEFLITKKTKIKAIAFANGFKKSPVVTKEIKAAVVEKEDPAVAKLSEKTKYSQSFDAENGIAYITLNPRKASNKMYYTTDGSAPTKKSKVYSKRLKFTELSVLRVVEYDAKGNAVSKLKLNVALKCAPVEFRCIDISVGTKTIELISATPGAKIYYTINGVIPEPGSAQIYTGPITLGDKTLLRTIVYKDGYKKSVIKNSEVSDIPLTLTKLDYNDPIFAEVISEINKYRKQNGVRELLFDRQLTECANIRAKELLALNDHMRPSGGYYTSLFMEKGVAVKQNAEFIATFYPTAKELVAALLANRENNVLIADGYNYNKIGVGYYRYGDSLYWAIIIGERE